MISMEFYQRAKKSTLF